MRRDFHAWFALAILVAIGLYVVLDRQVVVLQIEAIRHELGLSDFQIGLLQGLSLALFAAVAGYPIGWLADRFDRRIVLALCIAVWSVAVVVSGLSRNFTELVIASAIVGAGEAGVTPIAYALIPELFKGARRQLANSIYMVGGRFGVGLAIAAAGLLIANVETARSILPAALQDLPTWRLALIASALPGLPILVLVALLPGSRLKVTAPAAAVASGAPPVLPFLRAHRLTFGSFYVGVGMLVFGFSAVGAFTPIIAMRSMGASAAEVGNAMGLATVIATGVGLALSIALTRALAAREGARMPITMLSAASLLGAVASGVLPAVATATQLFVAFGVGLVCVMIGAMTFPTALQDMTPAPLRTRLVSIVIVVNTVLSAFAPPLVGALSDRIPGEARGLLWAMSAVATVGLLVSFAALRFCARHYERTIAAASAESGRSSSPPSGLP